MENKKGKKVVKNYIYNTSYQILAIILPIIITPYISRVLGAEMIGTYSYSYSIAYYFVMFIMLGLNNYGNRTIAKVRDNKEKLSKTFWEIYLVQIINGIVVSIIYILFVCLFFNKLMMWILLIYVISAIFDINWFFFGMEEFKLTVVRNSIIKILTTIGIFIFVKESKDIYLYALIMTLGILLSQCVVWPFVKKYVYYTKVKFKDLKIHIKQNLILFIPVVAISLYKIMDKIMLGSIGSIEHVGYYESTEKIVQVPISLINSLGTVMLPQMSNLVSKQEEKQAKKYFELSIIFVMFLSSSICFGIMGVSEEFVPLFYGKGYEQCEILFKILMPSCIFLAFANVVRTQFLIPNKEDKIYIKSVIYGAIVNLVINILLIPKFNSTGAAIGTFLAEFVVCVAQIIMVKNKIKNLKKYILESIPLVLGGIIMYLILKLISKSSFNIYMILSEKIILGAILYITFSIVYIAYLYKKKILILE